MAQCPVGNSTARKGVARWWSPPWGRNQGSKGAAPPPLQEVEAIDKRLEEAEVVVQHLELNLCNVACDDPGDTGWHWAGLATRCDPVGSVNKGVGKRRGFS